MKVTIRKYQEIKLAAETAQSARDQAVGAYEVAKQRLKKEWNCESLSAAQKLLEKTMEQEQRLQTKLEARLVQFTDRWSHLLNHDQS